MRWEEKFEALMKENQNLKRSLTRERNNRKQADEKLLAEINQAIEQLKNVVEQKNKAQQNSLDTMKESLDARLAEMQKDDSDHRFKLENLVATLATSLKNYNEE